jgi:hypothetical protein
VSILCRVVPDLPLIFVILRFKYVIDPFEILGRDEEVRQACMVNFAIYDIAVSIWWSDWSVEKAQRQAYKNLPDVMMRRRLDKLSVYLEFVLAHDFELRRFCNVFRKMHISRELEFMNQVLLRKMKPPMSTSLDA